MNRDSNECELLAVLTATDQETFARLFSIHRRRLKQMLTHRIDSRLLVRVDLSDILQEAYIDAFERIEHFLKKPGLTFYLWLRQITIQRLIDVHRAHLIAEKRSLRAELRQPGPRVNPTASRTWAKELVASQITPSQIAIQQELILKVVKSLESMDPIDREILALRHFEELKNNEVAALLELSPAAASNRYIRALQRLRDILKEEIGSSGE